MFKHNLFITIHTKDQKTIDAIFNNISNKNGVFCGEGSFSNNSTWKCENIGDTKEAAAIEILDRILVGHVKSVVDWDAMKDATQIVKEYKELHNK